MFAIFFFYHNENLLAADVLYNYRMQMLFLAVKVICVSEVVAYNRKRYNK